MSVSNPSLYHIRHIGVYRSSEGALATKYNVTVGKVTLDGVIDVGSASVTYRELVSVQRFRAAFLIQTNLSFDLTSQEFNRMVSEALLRRELYMREQRASTAKLRPRRLAVVRAD